MVWLEDEGGRIAFGTASVGSSRLTRSKSQVFQHLVQTKQEAVHVSDVVSRNPLKVGQKCSLKVLPVSFDQPFFNGITLRNKLKQISEPSPWYSSNQSPWGEAILPPAIIFHLTQPCPFVADMVEPEILACEVRTFWGPITHGGYVVQHEILELSKSFLWILSSLSDESTSELLAEVTTAYSVGVVSGRVARGVACL